MNRCDFLSGCWGFYFECVLVIKFIFNGFLNGGMVGGFEYIFLIDYLLYFMNLWNVFVIDN